MFKYQIKFDLNWKVTLSDYITGIAWSPSGQFLAASSASGEVAVWQSPTDYQVLLSLSDNAIDCWEHLSLALSIYTQRNRRSH
jgi:WD40 repeat protein